MVLVAHSTKHIKMTTAILYTLFQEIEESIPNLFSEVVGIILLLKSNWKI